MSILIANQYDWWREFTIYYKVLEPITEYLLALRYLINLLNHISSILQQFCLFKSQVLRNSTFGVAHYLVDQTLSVIRGLKNHFQSELYWSKPTPKRLI